MLEDRECNPLFVTMNKICKLYFKRDNSLQLHTSNSLIDYQLPCPPLNIHSKEKGIFPWYLRNREVDLHCKCQSETRAANVTGNFLAIIFFLKCEAMKPVTDFARDKSPPRWLFGFKASVSETGNTRTAPFPTPSPTPAPTPATPLPSLTHTPFRFSRSSHTSDLKFGYFCGYPARCLAWGWLARCQYTVTW